VTYVICAYILRMGDSSRNRTDVPWCCSKDEQTGRYTKRELALLMDVRQHLDSCLSTPLTQIYSLVVVSHDRVSTVSLAEI
jgi:hypothetical protein